MATCKDCIHNSVCSLWRAEEGQDAKLYAETLSGGCAFFADKSRFVKLPIKVGDKAFVPMLGHVITFIVERIELDSLEDVPTMRMHHGKHLIWEVELSEVSKTVFLTREEAEAELIKRENKPLTAPDNAEHCVCCGDVIPEGRQVCPKCEKGT
jgi:hypothetical protein